MNIGNLVNYEASHVYELEDVVTGEGLGVTFTLISEKADAPKAVARHHIDGRLAKKKNKPITSKESELFSLDTLAASITGWDWGDETFEFDIEGDGDLVAQDLAFSVANVKNILTLAPWIADQLREEVNDIENFTKS